MANVWTIDQANATIVSNADGGFDVDFPLLLNGTKVSDIKGHMAAGTRPDGTPVGFLTVTVANQPGAVPIVEFQAWSTNA